MMRAPWTFFSPISSSNFALLYILYEKKKKRPGHGAGAAEAWIDISACSSSRKWRFIKKYTQYKERKKRVRLSDIAALNNNKNKYIYIPPFLLAKERSSKQQQQAPSYTLGTGAGAYTGSKYQLAPIHFYRFFSLSLSPLFLFIYILSETPPIPPTLTVQYKMLRRVLESSGEWS